MPFSYLAPDAEGSLFVFVESILGLPFGKNGRAGEIRTHDLLHPMQAFYQAELRPDLMARLFAQPGWESDLGVARHVCN